MGLYLIAASGFFKLANYWSGLQVVLGVGFVIFVHELGHFLVAKACGVKCEKFYVGFDVPIWKFPRALFKFQWGETEYGIGIVPLGGYVKMLGQHDDPREAEAEAERTQATADGQVDPRSYTAKSVPQRMAIISAGVIMNVIFAVVFATIAFRYGVPYEPCIVAGTVPGDPAWVAELQPGDKIVQIHKTEKPSDHLRFDKDLVMNVVLSKDKPLDLLIQRKTGEREWHSLTPSKRLVSRNKDRVTIGITFSPTKLTVANTPDGLKGLLRRIPNLSELQAGDKLVSVNGQEISEPYELDAFLAQHASESLRFGVERSAAGEPSTQRSGAFEYVLKPSTMRWLGFTVKMTPLIAVQPNSPAGKAGMRAGDRLLEIDGEAVGDPLTLTQRIAAKIDREVTIKLERTDAGREAQELSLTLTPRAPRTVNHARTPNCSLGLDTLGVAYQVENVVQEILPNTPAAASGIQPGDVIRSVAFVAANPASLKSEKEINSRFEKPIELFENESDWPFIHDAIQYLLPDSSVKLVVSRQGEKKELVIGTAPSEFWNEERFLPLEPVSQLHQAQTWAEAVPLGIRETKEQLFGIVRFLKSLVSGGLSFTNLGGPGTIAMVAFAEASRGLTRLLIFLTFLSANLAVLNVLPIPALDGGHLVFLTWEGIVRRPPNPHVQGWITLVGVGFLLLLMIVVIGLDISRF